QLAERLRREQELQLARRPVLVEVAQPAGELLAPLVERELAALDIDARALELLVERAPPPLEQAQALARQVELALGAVELGQLLRFLALEPGRGLAVLAGEPPCLFQLLALGRLEAVLREGRRPEQEREGERCGAGRTEAHGPTARSTRESAISDAIQA